MNHSHASALQQQLTRFVVDAAVLQVQELLGLRRYSALASQASSQSVAIVAASFLRFGRGGGFAFCYVRAVVHKRILLRTLHALQVSWMQVLWPKQPPEPVAPPAAALATAAAVSTPTAKATAALARVCCLPNPTRRRIGCRIEHIGRGWPDGCCQGHRASQEASGCQPCRASAARSRRHRGRGSRWRRLRG